MVYFDRGLFFCQEENGGAHHEVMPRSAAAQHCSPPTISGGVEIISVKDLDPKFLPYSAL